MLATVHRDDREQERENRRGDPAVIPRATLRAPLWRRALAWIRRRTITAITPRCETCARYAGSMPDSLIVMLHEAHTNADRWIRIAQGDAERRSSHIANFELGRPAPTSLTGPGESVRK